MHTLCDAYIRLNILISSNTYCFFVVKTFNIFLELFEANSTELLSIITTLHCAIVPRVKLTV